MAFAYLPKGSKTYRIGYYDEITGRRTSKSAKTRDAAVARRKAKDFTAEQRLGIKNSNLLKDDQSSITISAAKELFFSHKVLSDKTKALYSIALTHLIQAVGDKPISRFNNHDYLKLEQHFNNSTYKNPAKAEIVKNLSQNSKVTYLRHLKAFFSWLQKNKFITENYIQLPRAEKKETHVIPQADLERIFADLKKTNILHHNIMMFKYLAALRANEVVSAEVSDIDLAKGILVVNNAKGKRRDKIPIPNDLHAHILTMALPKSGLLFPGLNYNILKTLWQRCMHRLQLKYNIHMLRKTRGTILAESGVNPFFLRDFLRHESLATTEQYYVSVNVNKSRLEINAKLNLPPVGEKKSISKSISKTQKD